MIYEIIGIGIIGVIIAGLVKEIKPSFVVAVTLATSIVLIAVVVGQCKELFLKIEDYINSSSTSSGIIKLALKLVGIGYVIEFGTDVAIDSGFQSIANKIMFAGKIVIATMCVPYLFDFFDTIMGLL